MTEAEWLTATRPDLMFDYLHASGSGRSKSGQRRVRLVGCASARRVQHSMTESGRDWLAKAEAIADGAKKRQRIEGEARRSIHFGPSDGQWTDYRSDMAAYLTLAESPMLGAARSAAAVAEAVAAHRNQAELAYQAGLIRDIFGNPFRPVAFDPRWRTADVTALACGIYEDRAFKRLPLLADALMDAGCDREDILAHCRSDGPHVRGCWVVDLVLGKE